MTTAMLIREISIRCAHCKERHGSVAEVRACAAGPVEPPVVFEPVTEPGMYRTDDVFLVVASESGRLYAKKLVKVMKGDKVHKLTYEYDKGSIYKISATDRMTVDEVAALGVATAHCWVCSRKLTKKVSIEAGIGPVCATKV